MYMYVVENKRLAINLLCCQVGETNENTLTIKASKLTEGQQYELRVFAENSIGQGPPCTSEPITAKLPFGERSSHVRKQRFIQSKR